MIIMVSEDGKVSLEERKNFRGFHLASAMAADRRAELSTAAATAGIRIDGDHAWIPTVWVAGQAVDLGADWTAEFDKMVTYARSKGWMDESGAAIRAHIEWPDERPDDV